MMEVNPGTWTDAGRFDVWDETLRGLFALYGAALWSAPPDRARSRRSMSARSGRACTP